MVDPPQGHLPGLPDRALSSSWPFVEVWRFPHEPSTVFERVLAAMSTLQWRVTGTDADDHIVGGSIRSSLRHLEADDVEIDVAAEADGASLVRIKAQPKLGHDVGTCRADAMRLITEMEHTLGSSEPGEPSPA